MGTEAQRSYFPTERCLFFMLGQQGFGNINSEDYWDGWDSLRLYLVGEAQKMGWGPKDIQRICGVGMWSHWFTKSQWTLIPEEHYLALRAASDNKAFLRPYTDEIVAEKKRLTLSGEHLAIKREFYKTRAYFDNAHDSMTDVWRFNSVAGEDRWNHPTPKPIELLGRILKSSSLPESVVLDPFLGSGSTLIACQTYNRICYGAELLPEYCAVILERYLTVFGQEPVLAEAKRRRKAR